MTPDQTTPNGTILFDGVCVLCSAFFRFVARRDTAVTFRFLAIQSDRGRSLARAIGIDPETPATMALLLDGHVLLRSDAAIEILRRLPRWRWAGLLCLIPRPLRDPLYTAIAQNRYRLFGRRETCIVPTPELRQHMLPDHPP